MESCVFCDRSQLNERMIMETTGFYVVSSLGQVVPGYTVVIPRRHTASFAELTVPELAEFTLLAAQLTGALVGVYGLWPAIFEHGIGGQMVKHAHIHMTPVSTGAAQAMRVRIEADYGAPVKIGSYAPKVEKVPERLARGSYAELRELRRGQRYLLFGDHVFIIPEEREVRPGYLREVLADAVGAPEWADWRNVDQEEDAERWRETRDLIRAYLGTAGVPLEGNWHS